MELLYCKQDLLLHGKVYISSQTVHSANLEPRFLLIVLLLILFPCSLIRFSKKKSSCSFISSCFIINFQKNSYSFIWYLRVFISYFVFCNHSVHFWNSFQKHYLPIVPSQGKVALELGFSILFLQQIVVGDIKLVLLAIKEG